MKNQANKSPFGRGHFPVGTVCEVSSTGNRGNGPRVVTTTGLIANGLNNFCLLTDEPDEMTDTFICSIDHVTRIIKRGPGVAKDARRSDVKIRENVRESTASRREYFKCVKPKSHYLSFDADSLIRMVAEDHLTDDMLLDNGKLVLMVRERGLLKEILTAEGEDMGIVGILAPKKKLRKAVRQLINKCLCNRVKAEAEEQAEQYEQYKRDMEEDDQRLYG